MSEASRQIARQIFHEAMAATTVDAACSRLLSVRDGTLHAGAYRYDLAAFTSVQIVSIGKAGATLFEAVRRILPADLPVRSVISAPFPRKRSAHPMFPLPAGIRCRTWLPLRPQRLRLRCYGAPMKRRWCYF